MSNAAHDDDAERRDASSGVPASKPPPEDGRADGLDVLLDSWVSRYCPECNSHYHTSEGACPKDGVPLRDLSVDFTSDDGAGFPDGDGSPNTTTPPPHLHDLPAVERLPEVFGDKWIRVLERGRGSFGRFFAGEHRILHMQVGIKVLRRRFTTSSATRRLFYQEAMRLSRLDHPNVVKVLDYGEEGEQPYLVMEYLTGTPLHRHLDKGTLSLDDKVEIMCQTAAALVAAHRGIDGKGPLVHLDLKPEHIFVEKTDGSWHVKVIDFGIAEIVAAHDTTEVPGSPPAPRHYAGTLPYMAPERWRGVIDPRCDIYSLGVVLYELIAGTKPFEAASPDAWRKAHETAQPRPPGSRQHHARTSALRELDHIALWCLEKDPAMRPQSAEVLAAALKRWQARPRKSLARRLAGAAVIPSLIAILAAGVLYWAPWEKIAMPLAVKCITDTRGVEIVASVPGFDRDGSEACLSLSAKGRTCSIRLGVVANGVIRGWTPTGEELTQKLKVNVPEEVRARIVVRGRFGRTMESDDFGIPADCRPPRITHINGIAYRQGDKVPMLVAPGNLGESEVTITADEMLGSACRLNQCIAELSEDELTARFKVSLANETFSIMLFDAAGNGPSEYRVPVSWEHGFPKYPDLGRFEVEGAGSTADRPLHGLGCPSQKETDTVTFNYKIDYPFAHTVAIEPSFLTRAQELRPSEGSFTLTIGQLAKSLADDASSMEVTLVVKDVLYERLKQPQGPWTKRSRVFFDPPFPSAPVAIQPEDRAAVRDDEVTLRIDAKDPAIASILVDRTPAQLEGDSYARRVRIAPTGVTTVTVELVRKCGATQTYSRRYRRMPMDRRTYAFALDESRRIEFDYFTYKDPDNGQDEQVWVLQGEAWGRFLGAFCPEAARDGFSVKEAKAAARLLTDKLRAKGLLPADGHPAQLPIERELKALWQAKRLPATRFEWVAGQGERLYLAEKTGAESFRLCDAYERERANIATFRVLINDRGGRGLSPKDAIEVLPADGGAK